MIKLAGKYSEFVGGKVTPKDAKLLKDSEYTVRHAVEYFVAHITSNKKMLEVEKFFLEEDYRDQKINMIPIEQRIEEINQELGVLEVDGAEYSIEVSNALNVVKNHYLYAKEKYPSKHSLELAEFITQNDSMINNQALACNMTFDEFTEVLVNYVGS